MYFSIEGFMIFSVSTIYFIKCFSGSPGTGDIIYQPAAMECLGDEYLGNLCYCIRIQFKDGYLQSEWVVEFKTKKERDKVFAKMIDDLAAGKQILRIPATARVR